MYIEFLQKMRINYKHILHSTFSVYLFRICYSKGQNSFCWVLRGWWREGGGGVGGKGGGGGRGEK
jgi:hypothetical protein